MAFEAFLAQKTAARSGRRRLTYALSLIVHGALLTAGIAYSFWRVDELSPPTVRVTFMGAPPPLPAAPPLPPAGGGGETKKKVVAKPHPSSSALVQPKLIQPKKPEPEPEPERKNDQDDDDDRGFAGGKAGGTAGGKIGGEIGGKIGGTIGGKIGGNVGGSVGGDATGAPVSAAPKMLPPQLGALQKIEGADPDFPPVLRRSGIVYLVLAKICVSRTGAVDGVTILKGADPLLDRNVAVAVQRWRYRPLQANDTAVPFCYPGRFEFKSD